MNSRERSSCETNAKGGWEGGAARLVWTAKGSTPDMESKTFMLALFLFVVHVLSCNAKSHPSYFENSGSSDQTNWGIPTFQILDTCSLGSPFMTHPVSIFCIFCSSI